jgi:hypothetical protein
VFTATADDQTYGDGFSLVASPDVAQDLANRIGQWQALLAEAPRVGAVHTSPLLLRMLAEANVQRATIIGMRARILHRWPKLKGAELIYPSAGEISPVRLTFDLDSENPVALRVRKSGKVAGPYFGAGYAISLSRGAEPARLAMSGRTWRNYVIWESRPMSRSVDGGGS